MLCRSVGRHTFFESKGAVMPGPGFPELLVIGTICLLFFVVPVVAVALLLRRTWQPTGDPQAAGRVPCPHCGEPIMPQALKCRFCGEDVQQQPGSTTGGC